MDINIPLLIIQNENSVLNEIVIKICGKRRKGEVKSVKVETFSYAWYFEIESDYYKESVY